MVMPKMNGFEVYNQLLSAEHKRFLPVIMITSKNDNELKEQALGLGIHYFLEKPIKSNELIAVTLNILKINNLYRKSHDQTERLEINYHHLESDLVNSLLLSVKFRDLETSEHINRVSNIVKIIATASGVAESVVEQLTIASKLHDIGKVGIPDEILTKVDILTTEEWEFMKKHTTIGESILTVHASELMQLAAVIAKTHHENWDGTGYPQKLKGNEIPIAGRIVAIADVFDALLTERPYKNAWRTDQAVAYMEQQSGHKFDPKLVKIFIDRIDDVISLYEPEMIHYN